MSANDRQVGGEHYKREYQHWDFVTDTEMPYVLGCSTKYVSRWREKNGKEDLEKSLHYLHKAVERKILMPSEFDGALLLKFCKQLYPEDANVVHAICNNQFVDAIVIVEYLIHSIDSEPPTYTQG